MVLIHGGSLKGAETIASLWGDTRKVTQIVFKPDWSRHKNAALFKRNDAMLEALPIGVIAFPGSGIAQNLADKARKMASRSGGSAAGTAARDAPLRGQAGDGEERQGRWLTQPMAGRGGTPQIAQKVDRRVECRSRGR